MGPGWHSGGRPGLLTRVLTADIWGGDGDGAAADRPAAGARGGRR